MLRGLHLTLLSYSVNLLFITLINDRFGNCLFVISYLYVSLSYIPLYVVILSLIGSFQCSRSESRPISCLVINIDSDMCSDALVNFILCECALFVIGSVLCISHMWCLCAVTFSRIKCYKCDTKITRFPLIVEYTTTYYFQYLCQYNSPLILL